MKNYYRIKIKVITMIATPIHTPVNILSFLTSLSISSLSSGVTH